MGQSSSWEQQWARRGYNPAWHVQRIPAPIRRAVEEGWFPAGSELLDIGCGSGEIAAWLAGQGFRVTGVDVAPSAIDRARAAHGGQPGLAFEVADIRHATLPAGRFGSLLDRGCLHGLGRDQERYVAQIAAAAAEEARWLLLHVIRPGTSRAELIEQIGRLCRGSFHLEQITDTVMIPGTEKSQEWPGLAFWFRRLARAAPPHPESSYPAA